MLNEEGGVRNRWHKNTLAYEASKNYKTESTDWEAYSLDVLSMRKGKELVTPKEKGKEKLVPICGKRKSGGIEIREPAFEPPRRSSQQKELVESKRLGMFSTKLCIGERDVVVRKLVEEAPAFANLYENG